jgi:hypothetical protein
VLPPQGASIWPQAAQLPPTHDPVQQSLSSKQNPVALQPRQVEAAQVPEQHSEPLAHGPPPVFLQQRPLGPHETAGMSEQQTLLPKHDPPSPLQGGGGGGPTHTPAVQVEPGQHGAPALQDAPSARHAAHWCDVLSQIPLQQSVGLLHVVPTFLQQLPEAPHDRPLQHSASRVQLAASCPHAAHW